MTRAASGRVAVAVVLLAALALLVTNFVAGARPGDETEAAAAAASRRIGPERYTGPQGGVGQFVVQCLRSHAADDDPIVHPGHAGMSHRHDFYGATGVRAGSTAAQLRRQPTTCDKTVDTAAYWHPTLYDHGQPVRPRSLEAYYRAAPGTEPTAVRPFPLGLAMIAGDADARGPQRDGAAGWTCGARADLHAMPPDCPGTAPLHLVLTFPDCWDGERVDSPDHRAHVAYSRRGRCPATHPVSVPQLTMAATFPVTGGGHTLRLSSGPVTSAHGDFLNGWDPAGLTREVVQCIHRGVVCDLASNRQESPLFQTR
ncbi:MAG: DUF1996 domain-containing protein [Acidimicrobiia bacterium]